MKLSVKCEHCGEEMEDSFPYYEALVGTGEVAPAVFHQPCLFEFRERGGEFCALRLHPGRVWLDGVRQDVRAGDDALADRSIEIFIPTREQLAEFLKALA